MGPNTLIVIDLLETSLLAALKIREALAKAVAEGRDVTDEEVKAAVDANNLKSQEFLSE